MIRDELLAGAPSVPVEDGTPLLEGLLDSAGLMQLVTCIEEEFGVDVDDAEIAATHFATPADVARMIEAKLAARQGSSDEADDVSQRRQR